MGEAVTIQHRLSLWQPLHLGLRKEGIRASTDTGCDRGHHNTREVEQESDSGGQEGTWGICLLSSVFTLHFVDFTFSCPFPVTLER